MLNKDLFNRKELLQKKFVFEIVINIAHCILNLRSLNLRANRKLNKSWVIVLLYFISLLTPRFVYADSYETIMILNQVGFIRMYFGSDEQLVIEYNNGVYIYDIGTENWQKLSSDENDRVVLCGANNQGDILWYEAFNNGSKILYYYSGAGRIRNFEGRTASPPNIRGEFITSIDNEIYKGTRTSNDLVQLTNDGLPKYTRRLNDQGDVAWVAMTTPREPDIYFYDGRTSEIIKVSESPLTGEPITLDLSNRLLWQMPQDPFVVWDDCPASYCRIYLSRFLTNREIKELIDPDYNFQSANINNYGDVAMQGTKRIFEGQEPTPEARYDIFLYRKSIGTFYKIPSDYNINSALLREGPGLNDLGDVVYTSKNNNQSILNLFESSTNTTTEVAETEQDRSICFYRIENLGHNIVWSDCAFTDGVSHSYNLYLSIRKYSPIANAGTDKYAEAGSTVTMDGSLSTDKDNSQDQLLFNWRQITGTPVEIIGSNSMTPSFIAPEIQEALEFEMQVTDPDGQTSSDYIKIHIWDISDPLGDADGDGLLNQWESEGIDVDNDGLIDLDLPRMGANPLHKDVFVEVDYEELNEAHNHQLLSGVVENIIWTFIDAPVPNPDGASGIKIHVDAGPNSIMNPSDDFAPGETWATGETWGTLSRSNAFPENESGFGAGTVTGIALDDIKDIHFPIERRSVFHYALSVHVMANLPNQGGKSFGEDFIITSITWSGPQTSQGQASTFVHELGHTFGLGHGGRGNVNNKPNYLSIMNYSFANGLSIQFGGCKTIDYSFDSLPPLIESELSEGNGLHGPPEITCYGTIWDCEDGTKKFGYPVNDFLDWNCNQVIENNVSTDINDDGLLNQLNGFDDWEHIKLPFGSGLNDNLSVFEEADTYEDLPIEEFINSVTQIGVDVSSNGPDEMAIGDLANIKFSITNIGLKTHDFLIKSTSLQGWVNLTKVPKTINLGPGEKQDFVVRVEVPKNCDVGTVESVMFEVNSLSHWQIRDASKVKIKVSETPKNWPKAHAGELMIVNAEKKGFVNVMLDASKSVHYDNKPLFYKWKGPFGQAEGISPKVKLPVGKHNVMLYVQDENGQEDIDNLIIIVNGEKQSRCKFFIFGGTIAAILTTLIIILSQ